MKVLWITNILFPDICEELGRPAPVTGGWMKSLADALIAQYPDIELSVATVYGLHHKLFTKQIGRISYYCLPFSESRTEYTKEIEKYWKEIQILIQPDLVHIHGTEYPHGLAYMKACGNGNVVISIQGLVGAYARYSLGQIAIKQLNKYRTLYDYLRFSILNMPKEMEIQGRLENEYISLGKHIIGRTDWDRAHTWAINPNVKYHFCNETLRKPFYTDKKWNFDTCEPYSIFLSQAHKPIKGIHKVIEALPYIIREFPSTKVYISGNNFISRKTLNEKLRFGTYANYINHLMKKYQIRDKLIFTGMLDEYQIAEQYKRAHVFICPSSIENSPNSIGEAQLLGVPCIASYVGGVPNMVENEKTGLIYRFEEHEMLASLVCRIFREKELAIRLSEYGITEANQRHNRIENAKCIMNIYRSIYK